MSEKEVQNPQFEIAIQAIEIVEVRQKLPAKREEIEAFNFNINFNFNPQPDKNALVCECAVKIDSKSSGNELSFMQCSFIYSTKNLEKFMVKEGDKMTIPPQLATSLNETNYNAMRGMMFSQFKGTPLHHAILPLIDASKLKRNQ